MIATKIDRMGPDAAYSKAKWIKGEPGGCKLGILLILIFTKASKVWTKNARATYLGNSVGTTSKKRRLES